LSAGAVPEVDDFQPKLDKAVKALDTALKDARERARDWQNMAEQLVRL